MKKILWSVAGIAGLQILNDEIVSLLVLSLLAAVACCWLLKAAAGRN